MPVFTIQAPDGRKIRIQADDQATALKGAQEYAEQNPAQQAAQQPAAPAEPAAPTDNYLQQALSGLNEGVASGLGLPIDLINGAYKFGLSGINALAGTDFKGSDKPIGGGAFFKDVMAPTIKPRSKDEGQNIVRDIAESVGATMVPGLGTVAKAAKPLQVAATELASGLGSGLGGVAADQVAPGNPVAKFIGQIAGGLSPAGLSGAMRRAPVQAATAAAPTVDALTQMKNVTYKTADKLGVRYTPQAYRGLAANIVKAANDENISSTRHAAAYSMLGDIVKQVGNAPTLTQLDQLRQVVRRDLINPSYSALDRSKDADAHFGNLMLDEIDDFIARAGAKDVASGDPTRAATVIKSARELNTRLRKTEMIQDALVRAQRRADSTGSGGNINNAIRQNVRSILDSPKKVRAFSTDERAAMEGLVRQGKSEDLLRWLGKFSPGGNGLIGLLETLGTLHNPAAAALPVAGMVAKGVADRGTLNKAAALQALIARGAPPPPVPQLPFLSPVQRAALPAIAYGQAAQINDPGGAR